MKVLIVHRKGENIEHINVVKQKLASKGIDAVSLAEDKKQRFTSNLDSWVRDCVSGYNMDGTKRYEGFVLIGQYADLEAKKVMSLAFANSEPSWFIHDQQFKKLFGFELENPDIWKVTDERST